MRIIFIRHGESEHNAKTNVEDKEDSPLTKRGKKQAEYLGKKLKNQEISAIYTSNLSRAKETAEIISKIIKVPIKGTFEELNEYLSKVLKSRIRQLLNSRLKRLKKLLKKISQERKKDKTILIIAHGITNKISIAYLVNLPLKKQLLRLRQNNTCTNVIIWSEYFKNWAIDSLNDTSHLPIKLVGDRK